MRGRLHGEPDVLVAEDARVVVDPDVLQHLVGTIGAVVREGQPDRPDQRKDVDRQEEDNGRRDEDPRDRPVRQAADPFRQRLRRRHGGAGREAGNGGVGHGRALNSGRRRGYPPLPVPPPPGGRERSPGARLKRRTALSRLMRASPPPGGGGTRERGPPLDGGKPPPPSPHSLPSSLKTSVSPRSACRGLPARCPGRRPRSRAGASGRPGAARRRTAPARSPDLTHGRQEVGREGLAFLKDGSFRTALWQE